MSDPLAYFLTWTTYGTWLHGNERGWIDRHHNRVGDPIPSGSRVRRQSAVKALKNTPVRLPEEARTLVEATIRRVCEIRQWHLWAVNCRSNHVHVVTTAPETPPERVMNSLKSWCSRDLNDKLGHKEKWWTRHGSTRYVNDESALAAAIVYVNEQQDWGNVTV